MKLTRKVLLLLILTIFGALAVTTTYELSKLRKQFTEEHLTAHKIIVTNLMSNLSGALFNIDDKRIRSQVASAFGFGDILSIMVIDDKGNVSTLFTRKGQEAPEEASSEAIKELIANLDTDRYREARSPFSTNTAAMVEDLGEKTPEIRRYIGTLWHFEDDRETFVGHIIFDFGMDMIAQKTNEAGIAKVLSAIVLAMALLLSIFLFLQRSVLSRLEYLREAVQRVGQRDYSAEIKVQGTDEIAILGRAFQAMVGEIQSYQKGLEAKVQERTRQLQESRDKIRLVLDTINQGILTFDADWKVGPEYSKKTPEILATQADSFAGKNLIEILTGRTSLSGDEFDRLKASVSAAFGEDEISWDTNSHNLPDEIEFLTPQGKRYLALTWEPMVNKETGVVENILLDVLDLTTQKALEEKSREESARNQKLIRLVQLVQHDSQASVERFLQQSIRRLSELRGMDRNDTITVLIGLHTLKGETRTLGFSDLSGVLHEAESRLKEKNFIKSQESIQSAIFILEQYLQIFKATFDATGKGSTTLVHVAAKLVALGNDQLRPLGRTIERFELIDAVGSWSPEFLESTLMPCLIHATRNTIDHGYIFPEKKFKQKKSIEMRLSAVVTETGVRVELSDKGYGLDVDEVMHKAKSLGIATQDLKAEDIIFLPEFSTASSVSESSGRGVGMSAIQDMVSATGGKVKFTSQSLQGSVLTIELPNDRKDILQSA